MNINDLMLAVKICHKAGISLFIHGMQGIGKSEGVYTYTANNFHFYDDDGNGDIPFGFVDMRCAQMEASEIRGLPDKDQESKRVIYYVPHELPSGEWINNRGETYGIPGDPKPEDTDEIQWTLHRGVLFGDEINRGEDDVLNAWFQLVYDRKVGEYTLPTGWSVVVAGNPSGSTFSVNTFVNDAAFKDRFCHVFIDIDEDYKRGWTNYIHGLEIPPELASRITQFCMMTDDHLFRSDDDRDDIRPIPSPRSWVMVSKVEVALLESDLDSDDYKRMRLDLISGLVGDVASHFIEHSIKILPSDIIDDGMTGKNVKILKALGRNQLQAFSWAVANNATNMSKPSDEQMDHVISFGKWIAEEDNLENKDLAVAFFDIILQSEQKNSVRSLSFANPSIAKLMNNLGKSGAWYSKILEDKWLKKFLQNSHLGQL